MEDIRDWLSYATQRDRLLRRLGVPPSLIKDKSVLEIGIGTGQKARHLLEHLPSMYVAVDGNPKSVATAGSQLERYSQDIPIELVEEDFLDVADDRKFDVVLAEAVVPTQRSPKVFLEKLKSHLRPGGILIYTCMDSCSLLSETLRRLISQHLSNDLLDEQQLTAHLVDFFGQDLDALKGMTRLRADWVTDQLIHPWTGPLLSFLDSLSLLATGIDFVGSVPTFFEDWRWYKEALEGPTDAEIAIEGFWRVAHDLLDYRLTTPSRAPETNRRLYAATDRLYISVIGNQYSQIGEVIPDLEEVISHVPQAAQPTHDSLQAFKAFAQTLDPAALKPMRAWWGRGQQYVSVELSPTSLAQDA